MSARWTRALGACALVLAAGRPAGAAGQPGNGVGQGIHHYRLRNGLDLVVAVRPELRLTAVNLTAAIGAIDDPVDESGMAHLLEHVTLGGSVTVGTLDPAAEKTALARLDRADRALRAERRKSPANPANPANPADTARLAELEQELEQAGQAARRAAEDGEILGGRLEAKGAIGLNATTSADATQYFGWIPPDSLELWVSLEADRLKHPIFRRFYSEREVVLQEIAVLTNGRPTLQDRIMSAVFPTGPQAQPRAGDPAEIREIDREMALEYFRRFYRPENLAVAVVGNVDPGAVHRLCERYLGDWQPSGAAGPLPPSPPPSEGGAAKTHVQSFNSVRSPIVFFAFPRPALTPVEQAGLDVLAELLNSPELSPLKRRMIDEAGIARSVVAESSYPSQKRPAVFLLWVGGSPGTEHEKLIRETRGILGTLGTLEGTSDEELAGAALQAEMRLAAELYDPPTLASLLALHQAVHGDWRRPFQRLEDLRRMAAKDVRAMAAKLLVVPAEEPR